MEGTKEKNPDFERNIFIPIFPDGVTIPPKRCLSRNSGDGIFPSNCEKMAILIGLELLVFIRKTDKTACHDPENAVFLTRKRRSPGDVVRHYYGGRLRHPFLAPEQRALPQTVPVS
jgi:hypothetical protein